MPSRELSLRPARLDDAPALTDLSRELGYPTEPSQTLRRLERLLDHPDHNVIVAERDGPAAGWIHVFAALRVESDPFAEIGGLVVGHGARRQGVGRRLVEVAAAWAAQRGLASLRVRTRIGRAEAPPFYRALGFSLGKTQEILTLAVPPRLPGLGDPHGSREA